MSVQAPIILCPNGGETLVEPTINIQWTASAPLDSGGLPCWFEVYFTDNYREDTEPNWIQIATVPSSQTNFVWSARPNISSNACRISVRTRNSEGVRSAYSLSAGTFTILRLGLPTPQVVSPVSNGRYDAILSIMLVEAAAIQRGYYHLSYSSVSAGIPRTTIANDIPASALPFVWETVRLPAASDYIFYAATVDRSGNVSDPATVSNIQINHEGLCVLDTVPPIASILIAGGQPYTRFNAVTVQVYAYDAATAVQAIQIEEIDNSGTPVTGGVGPPQLPKDAASFVLSSGDGFKNVSLLAQDFGANRNLGGVNRSFVNLLSTANTSVVAFDSVSTLTDDTLYVATTGTQNAIYKVTQFAHLLVTIDDTPTAIKQYQEQIYIATVDAINTGHIVAYTVTGFTSVYDFVNPDEWVTCMGALEDDMFWATNTGRLFSYDGINVVEVTNSTSRTLQNITGGVPVKSMTNDNSGLYVALGNGVTIYVYDGTNIYEVVS